MTTEQKIQVLREDFLKRNCADDQQIIRLIPAR